jgi:cyclopropane-fatty-acyl-phospholipid synthase
MDASRAVYAPVAAALLRRLGAGHLTIEWPDGTIQEFQGDDPGPAAVLEVKSGTAMRRLFTSGATGFAEGYMAEEWDTPDLLALLDLAMVNIRRGDLGDLPTPLKPLTRAWHRLNDNTRAGSRRNIEYHYDLGNDFYELWLDDTMTYSCALFDGGVQDEPTGCAPPADEESPGVCPEDPDAAVLCEAQRAKWDRLLEVLQPSRDDRILEIGCGWGGFAVHAAANAECRVTGITLSQEQFDYARAKVAEAGLEGRVDIRLQDYRDVPETYSRIASIEMFEAVGERWWPTFFESVRDRLERSGRAAIQTITICDESFETYRTRPDFTQRYIFPGGMLPSPSRFMQVAREAGLEPDEPRYFGQSYARTLETWLARFDDVWPQVEALGFDERFRRMWRYYLAYCRTGFRHENINVMQVSLDRR